MVTTVEIQKCNIHVYGHSGYSTYGSDIVCASISTLVETIYFSLKNTGSDVESVAKDGEFIIRLNKINKTGKSLIETFKTLVDDLAKQYPNNVRRIQ